MVPFRALQGLSSACMIGYWLVRVGTDPHHLHVTWIVAAVLAVAASEAGYRAGRHSVGEQLRREK